jgi:hypothetical protein
MEQVHEAGVPVAPDAVAAFDARDGSLIRALVFAEAGLERPGQCCPVLGWLDDTTVVFASNGDGPTRLLAWDTESLTITRVTEFEAGTLVSLAQLARATRLIGLERD